VSKVPNSTTDTPDPDAQLLALLADDPTTPTDSLARSLGITEQRICSSVQRRQAPPPLRAWAGHLLRFDATGAHWAVQ
jgi:hypothetical protein